jgi:hypothetical protein
MNTPVANWRQVVDQTFVYWDLTDGDVRLYGPRPMWRPLQRHDIADLSILNGVISFGYTSDEIATLALQFPGKRILPIVPSGVSPTLKPSNQFEEPNSCTLSVTPSLPFPDVTISCTIHRSGGGAPSIDTVEQQWAQRTFLTGVVNFDFDMRTALGGYNATVNYRACATWLASQGGVSSGLSKARFVDLIAQYISAEESNIISLFAMSEDGGQRDNVRQILIEILTEGVLFSRSSIINFDNGESLAKYEVRNPLELSLPVKKIYVHTDDDTEHVNFTFP